MALDVTEDAAALDVPGTSSVQWGGTETATARGMSRSKCISCKWFIDSASGEDLAAVVSIVSVTV